MKTRQDYQRANLLKYTRNIKTGVNFSHVKFGDGEILCMNQQLGDRAVNIDGHNFDARLGVALMEAVESLSKQADVYFADWFYSNPLPSVDVEYLGFWPNFINRFSLKPNYIQPFELINLGWGSLGTPYLFKFYQAIKQSKRHKIYVGPDRMRGITKVLNLDEYVEVARVNAFKGHNQVLSVLKDKLKDNSIILISIGMSSPVLIKHLLQYNPQITLLDVGSGLDPLLVGQTRGGDQPTMEQAQAYLAKL